MGTNDSTLGFALAFIPDGTILAVRSADYNQGVQLWDAATGESLGVIGTSWGPKQSIAFSPDGLLLAMEGWSSLDAGAQPAITLWAVK